MKIYIGSYMPGGTASGVYIQSIMGLSKTLSDAGHDVFYDFVEFEKNSVRAKNLLIEMFLSTDSDYFLYVSPDVAFNHIDVLKMVEAEKDFIGALIPEQEINWDNLSKVISKNPENIEEFSGKFYVDLDNSVDEFTLGSPLKVNSVKMGLTLIKKGPLVKLRATLDEYDYSSKIKLSTFFEPIIGSKGEYVEEDVSLSLKLKSQETELYIAPWVATGLYGNYFYRGNFATSVMADQEDKQKED